MLALIVVALFVSVALLTWVVLYPMLSKRELVRDRVARLMPQEEERPELVVKPKAWQAFLARLGVKLRMQEKEFQTFQEMTTASGFRKETVYIVFGLKILLGAGLPVAYFFFIALPKEIPLRPSLFFSVACAIAGYLIPTLWLEHKAQRRKDDIFHSLPDVLDLLTVCVEAGLGLDAALVKTVDSFQVPNDPLIREINIATMEIRAGRPRSEALKGVAERTMVDDVRAFVTMLVQTERFGTSLGRTLRTHSDSLRMKRKQLAEERAAKTAVKMLFPLTFCIFPAILIVMLVPAFFKIYGIFAK